MENFSKKLRTNESKEQKKEIMGTLGLDFIFHTDSQGNKKPICLELNGHKSGLNGMSRIKLNSLSEEKKYKRD